MRDPQVWSYVPVAIALVTHLYLELWAGSMGPAAFARRLRWMTICRGISRMALLAVGVAILIAMMVIAKVHWPHSTHRWVPEVNSGLIFAFLMSCILARLTAPRLERDGRVITLQRDAGRILSIHMRPAGIRKTFNQTYATKPNHIYLITSFLAEYQDILRVLGWHEVEVLSPDVSAKMVGREKFVRHVTTQLPGWRVAFIGARRMRLLRRMAYLTAQRKKTSDGCERGVVLSLT